HLAAGRAALREQPALRQRPQVTALAGGDGVLVAQLDRGRDHDCAVWARLRHDAVWARLRHDAVWARLRHDGLGLGLGLWLGGFAGRVRLSRLEAGDIGDPGAVAVRPPWPDSHPGA